MLNFQYARFVIPSFLTLVINHKVSVRETTRDNVEAHINLRSDIAERLATDSSTRAMIYCAADPMSPFSRVDIEFPYQVEIKINQDEVKASLRGLKNKPGTTRPADITSLLRARAGYRNEMVVTYALTKKVGGSTIESSCLACALCRMCVALSCTNEEVEVPYGSEPSQTSSRGRLGI